MLISGIITKTINFLLIEHYLEEGWSRQFSHFLANWNAEQCEESMDD